MAQLKLFLVTTSPERSEELQVALKDCADISFVGFYYSQNNPNYEELIKVTRPDVVLVDSETPGMDGIELHRLHQSKFPSIDTVVLLGDRDFDYVQNAYQAGVPLVLAPPVDWSDAVEKMAALSEMSL